MCKDTAAYKLPPKYFFGRDKNRGVWAMIKTGTDEFMSRDFSVGTKIKNPRRQFICAGDYVICGSLY